MLRVPSKKLVAAVKHKNAVMVKLSGTLTTETFLPLGWVISTVEGEGDPINVIIDADRVAKFVASLPDEVVTLDVANGRLVVSGEQASAQIPILAEDEFPITPEMPADWVSVPLIDALEQVAFCAADDTYNLNKIQVVVENGFLTAIASDGYSLSLCKKVCGDNVSLTVLIPKPSALYLTETFHPDEPVHVALVKNYFYVRNDTTTVIARVEDGEYPDIKSVIGGARDKATATITINADVLKKAIRQVTPFADKMSVAVWVTVDNGILTVNAKSDMGAAKTTIPVTSRDTCSHIAFNAPYWLQALAHCPDFEVNVLLTDRDNPSIIEGIEAEHYIMPLNLDVEEVQDD